MGQAECRALFLLRRQAEDGDCLKRGNGRSVLAPARWQCSLACGFALGQKGCRPYRHPKTGGGAGRFRSSRPLLGNCACGYFRPIQFLHAHGLQGVVPQDERLQALFAYRRSLPGIWTAFGAKPGSGRLFCRSCFVPDKSSQTI